MVITVAAIINGLSFGVVMGLYTIIGFGLVGFVVGGSLVEGFSPFKVLLFTIGAVFISNLNIGVASSYLFGFNYNQFFNEIINNISQFPEFADMQAVLEHQLQFVKMIIPSILVISSIASGALTYYASHWYLKNKGLRIEMYKPVYYWSFPRWWISIGIIITLIINGNIYLTNLNIILLFLVFLQGFAVGLYYLKKLPPFLTMVYVFVIIMFNIFSFFALAFVGLVDMWFNLRKLN